MGTALGALLNESKKIDVDNFLGKYFDQFHLEEKPRNDAFTTVIVTTEGYININKFKINPGTPLVLKIFPRGSDNYLKYSQEFINIQKNYSNLKSSPNVLPLLQLQDLKDANVGVLMRQYIKYNLNDIQYHMHCVSQIEKKWICLQLLYGLSQIHSKAKCHGDIKPNNIVLTSKLSVFLTDISVYKPAFLPIEDLQTYNTFFYSNEYDKSCYLAPERFVNNQEINKNKNELTREMDIFSLGVVMSEIFLEKFSIFTQNDIINYKNKKIDLKHKLEEIKDKKIKIILQKMIELNPKERAKLDDLISIFAESLCPSPVTKFMTRLNVMIVAFEYSQNDLLVALLNKHFEQIWKCLCIKNKNVKQLKVPKLKKKLNRKIIISLLNNPNTIYKTANKFDLAFIPNEDKKNFFETEINELFFEKKSLYDEDSNNDCTILIIKYLLSCLESARYVSTYSVIFEMIYYLSQILIKNENSVFILDIIVPYYINLFKNTNSRLIIEVFNSLIDLLLLINYDILILNQIDYNSFNNYIFDSIYKLFFQCNSLEVQCAIISRIVDIINLENNFLFAYLNTINYLTKKKEKEDNNLNKSLYNSKILFQSLVVNKTKSDDKNKKDSNEMNFDTMYKSYLSDLNDFKKKLKEIIENIMLNNNQEEYKANSDCLKLMVIQKYNEICMFVGNYNENILLFNYLYIIFNNNNYFIQKEIIKIFPSLILLFGRRIYFDYFLPIVESTCQKKNSELMIIEIIDSIYILTKTNLISHEDDYSRIYSILIPYLVHPNNLLRYKLETLFNYLIADKRNSVSQLYIACYQNIKNILLESKTNNSDKLTIINVISDKLIKSIEDYRRIPREIFLLYKYNIESSLFNNQYSHLEPLLKNITKIKMEHFDNKIKSSDLSQKNLGLVTKKEILNVKENKFYDIITKDLKKMLKNFGGENDNDTAFFQTNFINKITMLFDELNKDDKNKKSFIEKLYYLCGNKMYFEYSNILYLLKVLKYKLDKKNIELINFMQTSDDNFNNDNTYKDFMLISGSKCKSINLNMSLNINFLRNMEIKGKLCYNLLLNENESIIKLIPVNNILGNNYLSMLISISDEGFIRLHMICNEASFEDIYILKNCSSYQINYDNSFLRKNNISYIEQPNRITVIIAIKKKLHLVSFELNKEKDFKQSLDDLEKSYTNSTLECSSLKEIVAIENIYNNKKNYLAIGNDDNTISFYNYIDNKINYINNCASFSASYGNIELITTLSTTNNILVSTSLGFIVLYDYNLRLFSYIYSFSSKRKIKQILEHIPQDFNDLIFEQLENKKLDSEKGFIYILTDDNEITLLNLSLLKPIIICQFYHINKIEDFKKKKIANNEFLKVNKLSLENNDKYDKYRDLIRNDFSILNIGNDDVEIVKMDIPLNYYNDCCYSLMFIGDKSGNIRIFRFSNEILKKIKNKEGHKNNKFNRIIISNENLNIETRNDSKFKKNEGVFINRNIYSIQNKEKEEENLWTGEMNDLIFMKDFDKNTSYIISCYSNGIIKLYTI